MIASRPDIMETAGVPVSTWSGWVRRGQAKRLPDGRWEIDDEFLIGWVDRRISRGIRWYERRVA